MDLAKNLGNIVALLLLMAGVITLVFWAITNLPIPTVSGQTTQSIPLPKLTVKTESDEVDPEACLIVVQKELEGPILVEGEGGTKSLLREQEIIKVISACNVDDEIRPPNLERELDVDIEVFSSICEKRVDLSEPAICDVVRVAQDRNAPGLSE